MRSSPKASPISGESTMKAPIVRRPSEMRTSVPALATAAPAMPPTRACEELLGSPSQKVTRFQAIAPTNPAILTNVVFDASATQDEGAACGTSCNYSWDFGDGESGVGIFASHVYRTPGTFQVRLTVRVRLA